MTKWEMHRLCRRMAQVQYRLLISRIKLKIKMGIK